MTIKHVSVTIKAVINGKEITKSAGVDMHDDRNIYAQATPTPMQGSGFEDVIKTVQSLVLGLGSPYDTHA